MILERFHKKSGLGSLNFFFKWMWGGYDGNFKVCE